MTTNFLAVLGSVTPPGRLQRAIEWTLQTAVQVDPAAQPRLVNLADHRISFADGRPLKELGDDTAAVVGAIAAADAVLFASPVYRASFTGALKNLLDQTPVEALLGKPCGIVAMGATQHHYLGVDRHLRDVLAWFGALVAPTSVYLSSADFSEGVLSANAQADLRRLVAVVLRLRAASSSSDAYAGPLPLAVRQG